MADKLPTAVTSVQNSTGLVIQMYAPTLGEVATMRLSIMDPHGTLFQNIFDQINSASISITSQSARPNQQASQWNSFFSSNTFRSVVASRLVILATPTEICEELACKICVELLRDGYNKGFVYDLKSVTLTTQQAILDYYDNHAAVGSSLHTNFLSDSDTPDDIKSLLIILSDILEDVYLPLISVNNFPNNLQFEHRGFSQRRLGLSKDPGKLPEMNLSMHNISMPRKREFKEAGYRINKLISIDGHRNLLTGVNISPRPLREPFGAITRYDTKFDENGEMEFGLGTNVAQIMHELGHHIENHLSFHDFMLVHHFLQTRSLPSRVTRTVGWITLDKNGKAIPNLISGDGYNVEHISLDPTSDTYTPPIQPDEIPPQSTAEEFRSAQMANAARYSRTQFFLGKRLAHEKAIDEWFRINSNSSKTSYYTMFKSGPNDAYNTEFLSTTFELLASSESAILLIKRDPKRVAFLIYLTNKDLFYNIDEHFKEAQTNHSMNAVVDLKTFLNIF